MYYYIIYYIKLPTIVICVEIYLIRTKTEHYRKQPNYECT